MCTNISNAEMNIKKLDFLFEKVKKDIEKNNARKLFDINKQWEKIAMYILNIAYNWNLEDLNLLHPNFPGIDLGDYGQHIGVQVSTVSTPAKIKKSLKTIQNAKVNSRLVSEDYNNIYFFILGEKQKFYKVSFDVGENIIFTTDHIIDFNTFKGTFGRLDNEKQETILAVLNREINKKPKYQLSAAPATTCDFIDGSRQKEMGEIDKKFAESNIVFLWGLGGIGKTELAAEWGMHRADVYLVHYRGSIMDTILNMDFSGMHYIPSVSRMTDQQKKEEEFRFRLDILRDYYQNATIIIDNFDDGNMTLEEMKNQSDYKALVRLKNKFLFTTRFMVSQSSIHVTEMDIEDLLKLAKQNYNLFMEDNGDVSQSERISEGKFDKILKELINKVDRHTLTVDLMSKTLYESCGRLTPEQLFAAFNADNIDDYDMPIIAAYHNSYDSDYELLEQRIYDHLRILFNLAELDDRHRSVMRHAVLIPLEGMPVSIFRKCHTQDEQKAIERKIFHRSWLRLDRTHTTISMHSVIREVCRKELNPDDENCGSFLYSIRNSVNANHNNQELVKLAADTMSNAAEILSDASGEWSHMAGVYYRSFGMYQKSIDYLKKASEIREGYNDAILADIYSSLGNAYTNLRESEISISFHEKSLAICQCMPELDTGRIARRYNDLGLAYSYRAEEERDIRLYEKAIKCYEEALKWNRQAETINRIYISNILNNIGNTYSNIGKTCHDKSNYSVALQYHMEAKDMREAITNIFPKNLARSYKNIGNDYANLNINDLALEYRTKALELYQKVLHEGHPELANAFQDVGNTCRLTRNYDEAFRYYAEAEKIWEKQLPQNYYFLAKCQYAIGIVYSEQASTGEKKQYERALEYYKKALDSYGKASKPCVNEMASCKGAIGETCLKLERREDAIQFLKESNDTHTGNKKKSKLKQIKRYHHLGEICKKEKHFEEALGYFCKVLEIREAHFLHDFANMLEINFEIGCIYRDLRSPQDAMPYLEKALVICEEHFVDDRKKMHRIRKTIEITNGELKKIRRSKN